MNWNCSLSQFSFFTHSSIFVYLSISLSVSFSALPINIAFFISVSIYLPPFLLKCISKLFMVYKTKCVGTETVCKVMIKMAQPARNPSTARHEEVEEANMERLPALFLSRSLSSPTPVRFFIKYVWVYRLMLYRQSERMFVISISANPTAYTEPAIRHSTTSVNWMSGTTLWLHIIWSTRVARLCGPEFTI